MIFKDICVTRPYIKHGIYKMADHVSSARNPIRVNLLYTAVERMKYDGLSNLEKLNVKIIDVRNYSLYTHLKINVDKRDPEYFKKYANY